MMGTFKGFALIEFAGLFGSIIDPNTAYAVWETPRGMQAWFAGRSYAVPSTAVVTWLQSDSRGPIYPLAAA